MTDLAAFLARISPPQTPALIVRRSALAHNLATLQAACDAAGVRLRAHGKMHKCSTLARLQIAGGAIGVCCQTVGEAETYAAAGIADVMVTAPVPPWGWPRLAAIAGARVSAVVDSAAQVALASGSGLTLFVDVDPGTSRAGVAPGAALALARLIGATAGVTFGGIQAYAGHIQHMPPAERTAANAAATAMLAALVADFSAAGLAPLQVTGGGTGTHALDLAAGVFTEIQAGSYALMDVDYSVAGASAGDWPFEPALFLAATVVSARHKALVTCDAGLKALYTDGPPPQIVAGAAPGSRWRSMGDEHGAIIHPASLAAMRDGATVATLDATGDWHADAPAEGALVWLQPGHVDPTMALHDALFVADEDGSLERWAIDARRTS